MNASSPSSAVRGPNLSVVAAAGLVRIYQKTASPLLPAFFGTACGCRFYPTCSQYAIDALRTHGMLRGSWLAARRVVKCTPLHPGGHDPVPAAARNPS